MRITIDIPNEFHARLKARAKQEGTTMRAVILRAIERERQAGSPPAPASTTARPNLPLIRSKRPGTLKLGKERVYEYIDFP
jgi:hypothetical protein